MKVTVCFGNVRVVVPCGNGDIAIQELIDKAITRYKKAIGKPLDYWVCVHQLKSSGDGGILDPDDRLNDVADDREQIVAQYEEQDAPPVPHNGGDGTSASSVGTASPDMFTINDTKAFNQVNRRHNGKNDVIITENDLNAGSNLIVRRGSEPALNNIGDIEQHGQDPDVPMSNLKRWSAIASIDNSKSSRIHVSRKEPVGGRAEEDNREMQENKRNQLQDQLHKREDGTFITMKNTGGPLGIHVVPDYDENGRAQDVFKQALQTEEISLRVVKNKQVSKPAILTRPRVDKTEVTVKVSGGDGEDRKVAAVPPTQDQEDKPRRVPPAVPTRHPSTTLSSPTKTKFVAPTNTRRIGKKIVIELTKGSDGLGFSVTTRDNPAGGNCPIYIKNILPKGAAVRDGNLKSGDRLLEVNDVEMTGKSQSEAVAILRNTKPGSTVKLVVSRQVMESEPSATQPAQPPPQPTEEPAVKAGTVEVDENKTMPPPPSSGVVASGAVPGGVVPPSLEKCIYDIPLNDVGSAGLGVSVKGKTSTTDSGAHDLGIFIKSVISCGAASKDGRLKVNDQLLEVNNESLTGVSNAEAMDQLRTAMQKDGPKPGHIHLVIGRRKGTHAHETSSTSLNTSLDNKTSDTQTNTSQKTISSSKTSQNNHVMHDGSLDSTDGSSSTSPERPQTLGVSKARNPTLDRLTGINNARNESYQRATHESLNESKDSDREIPSHGPLPSSMIHGPMPNNNGLTISSPSSSRGETVLIEGDNYQVQMRQNQGSKVRPASTLGFSRPGGPDVFSLPTSRSNDDLEESTAPKAPAWLLEYDKRLSTTSQNTDTDLSPRDDDDNIFSREGFGRRSMSEKRRAHLDPRSSEFYQKLKLGKDQFSSATWDRRKTKQKAQMDEEQGRAGVVGPRLGLKKSSSLESLQTAVQEAVMDEEGGGRRSHVMNLGVVRGRGCNDSFRAAVDRSYDGVVETETMETLEEESSENGSDMHGQSITESNRLSLSGVNASLRLAPGDEAKRNSKKKVKKEAKTQPDKDLKDKGGLFKGLGHMFRFGRHRKQVEQGGQASSSDVQKQHEADVRRQQEELLIARKNADDEHSRIHEQYRKLQEREQQIELAHHRIREEQLRGVSHTRASSAVVEGTVSPIPQLDTSTVSQGSNYSNPASRTERIQQLRSEHQRKHRERQGQYPLEAQEEAYERQLQDYEQKKALAESHHKYQGNYSVPPRLRPESEFYDRPPSRYGYSQDPTHYTHYQNYNEIQSQLNDRYQRLYQAYGSSSERPHLVMAHQLTASELRQRAVTPDPSHFSSQLHHHPHDPRSYPRSHSSSDTRQWVVPHKHVYTAAPTRPRSVTPSSQLPYMHQPSSQAPVAMLPPQILVNAQPHHYHADYVYDHARKTSAFSAPEPNYGSLQRRRDDSNQNGIISGPAQV